MFRSLGFLSVILLAQFAPIPGASESQQSVYSVIIAGDVDDGYTHAEILAGDNLIAVIYELPAGWRIDLLQASSQPASDLVTAIDEAREALSHYVNRKGQNPPPGLTRAGFSLWLMEKDDGTAMGQPLRGGDE